MSEKHAAGPWSWDDEVWTAYDPAERAPWLVDANGNPILTGVIYCKSEQDARLIAAAPDLLEALQAMVDAHAIPSSICKERPVYEAALAAIRKATAD